MKYTESIKNGLRLVNQNWQLVLIQFLLSIVSCISVFIFVGIPLFIAVIVMGIDISELLKLKDFVSTMQDPFELIERYMGLGLVVLTSIMFYLLFAFFIWLYALGGSAGVITMSIRQRDYKFKFSDFFGNARALLFPLFGFTTVLGLILTAIIFVLGLMGGVIAYFASTMRETTLGIFLGVFSSLTFIMFMVIFAFIAMAFTIYGTAFIAFGERGAINVLKKTYRLLKDHPQALGLYGLMLLIYISIFLSFMILSLPINLIPILGTIIMLPFQLFLYALRGYLNLAIMGSLFTYVDIVTSLGSTAEAHISSEPAPQQELPLHETEDSPPEN